MIQVDRVIDIPNDYLAYYKLDGNANDETGNYNGTPTNVTWAAADRFGNSPNKTGTFSSAYINLTSFAIATTFTISYWLKLNSVGTTQMCLNSLSQSGAPQGGIYTNIDTDGTVRLVIANSGVNVIVNSPNSLNTGEWYNLTLQNSINGKLIYINGNEVAYNSSSLLHNYISTTYNYMGAYNTVGTVSGLFLDGVMDDAYIYNRVLNIKEIKALYRRF